MGDRFEPDSAAHGNLRGPEIFTRTTAEIVLYTILQLAKYKS